MFLLMTSFFRLEKFCCRIFIDSKRTYKTKINWKLSAFFLPRYYINHKSNTLELTIKRGSTIIRLMPFFRI